MDRKIKQMLVIVKWIYDDGVVDETVFDMKHVSIKQERDFNITELTRLIPDQTKLEITGEVKKNNKE